MDVHFDTSDSLVVACVGGMMQSGRQYGVSIRTLTVGEPKDGIPEDGDSNELEFYTYLRLKAQSVKLSPKEVSGKCRYQQIDLAFVVITTGSGSRIQGKSRLFRLNVTGYPRTEHPTEIHSGLRVRHLASMSEWSDGPARVYLSSEVDDREAQIQWLDYCSGNKGANPAGLEYPTPPPPNGSILATDSRVIEPVGRRVFYIDINGGISGVFDKFSDEKVAEHEEFSTACLQAKGTAATGGAGMLSVIGTIETGIQFFWVGPNGDIRTAISKGKGDSSGTEWKTTPNSDYQVWESIISEGEMKIHIDDTPESAPSRLLTCGIPGAEDKETTLLVWVNSSGRLKFVSVPNDPPWAGRIQPQPVDTDSLGASLSSDLVVTYTVDHDALQTWIFWITNEGGIRGACRTDPHQDGVTPGGEDFRAFDVMPPGSAHMATKMKLLPQHNRQEDRLVLIWYDADGVIRAASPMETKSPTGPWCRFNLLCLEARCNTDFTVIGQQQRGCWDKDGPSGVEPQWIFFSWIDAKPQEGVMRIMMESIQFDGTNMFLRGW